MLCRLVVVSLLVASSAPAWAEKIDKPFKTEFERTFRPNQTFAVVQQEGIPTTSVYGVDGKQTNAHFSIDVLEGRFKVSEGIFDLNQTAADVLNRGELMELASIGYHDNRVDMRFVSVEAHKVKRGDWIKTEKREPVATNFKFFLPFEKSHAVTPADMVEVLRYIEDWLKVFPNEAGARAYAAKMLSRRGGDEPRGSVSKSAQPSRAEAPRSEPQKAEKKEIKVGMTPLEVIDILGKPQKEVAFQNTSKWTYPDLTVIFENGKVKEVRF